jgi:hypothetical protein
MTKMTSEKKINKRPASAKLSIIMSNSRLKNLTNKINNEKEKLDSSRQQVVIDQSVEE